MAIRDKIEPLKVEQKSEEELAVEEPSVDVSAYDPFKYASQILNPKTPDIDDKMAEIQNIGTSF